MTSGQTVSQLRDSELHYLRFLQTITINPLLTPPSSSFVTQTSQLPRTGSPLVTRHTNHRENAGLIPASSNYGLSFPIPTATTSSSSSTEGATPASDRILGSLGIRQSSRAINRSAAQAEGCECADTADDWQD